MKEMKEKKLSRRQFLLLSGQGAVAVAVLAGCGGAAPAGPAEAPEADTMLAERQAEAEQRIRGDLAPGSSGPEPAYLVVNPLSFARRVLVDVSQLKGLPDVARPIYAAGQAGYHDDPKVTDAYQRDLDQA